MKAIVKALLTTVAIVAASGSAVLAADIIDAPLYETVPEIVPVEIGSGWYLRGDVSYDFETDYEGQSLAYAPATGYDEQDYDQWTLDDAVNVGAGLGYQFTDYFRGDLTAHYWSADIAGTNEDGAVCAVAFCGSVETGKVDAWELMANAYVDVGTFAGITPYVGAGVGGVNVSYEDFESSTYDSGGVVSDSLPGEESWRFAYALMGGVSYDLNQALKLDVGYRYVNVDEGDMYGFDSSAAALGASGVQGTDDGFDRHTIQAGVRYSLF